MVLSLKFFLFFCEVLSTLVRLNRGWRLAVFMIIVVIKASANSTDYFLRICPFQAQCWIFVRCITDCCDDKLIIPSHMELAVSAFQGWFNQWGCAPTLYQALAR